AVTPATCRGGCGCVPGHWNGKGPRSPQVLCGIHPPEGVSGVAGYRTCLAPKAQIGRPALRAYPPIVRGVRQGCNLSLPSFGTVADTVPNERKLPLDFEPGVRACVQDRETG